MVKMEDLLELLPDWHCSKIELLGIGDGREMMMSLPTPDKQQSRAVLYRARATTSSYGCCSRMIQAFLTCNVTG